MKAALMAIALLILTPGAAYAHTPADGPPPTQDRNGWFSPTFDDSPVNLILCTVPDACKF